MVAHMVCCRHPFSVAIGLCREDVGAAYFRRFAHDLVEETGEFVVNSPPTERPALTALLGGFSVRDGSRDKFEAAGLTAARGLCVAAPVVMESPLALECVVTQQVAVGTHSVFVGRVVAVHQEESEIEQSES